MEVDPLGPEGRWCRVRMSENKRAEESRYLLRSLLLPLTHNVELFFFITERDSKLALSFQRALTETCFEATEKVTPIHPHRHAL